MTTFSAEARDLVEHVNSHMPIGPGDERIVGPDYVLWLGASDHPACTVVQRIRFRDDNVAERVAEVRAILRARGRKQATWEISPSSTPRMLATCLHALHMHPFEEPIAAAMLLAEPPARTSSVRAARVTTVDDCVAAFEVLNTVFAERTETPAERRARAESTLAVGQSAIFLARLDGEPIAAAHSIYFPSAVLLGGAATLPAARGRGAYRALITARHDDAAEQGTPTLAIQAGRMSRPILERLGFQTVAEIQILLDSP
jgi:hypothetical protein